MKLINFQPTHYSASQVVELLETIEWSDTVERAVDGHRGRKARLKGCPACSQTQEEGHVDEPLAGGSVGASDMKPGRGTCMLFWVLQQARRDVSRPSPESGGNRP